MKTADRFPSTRTLYAGANMTPERAAKFRLGATVRLPKTTLFEDDSVARTYATTPGGSPKENKDVELRFKRGTPVSLGTDLNYHTAGDFNVTSVTRTTDPFWKTPLLRVTIAVDSIVRRPGDGSWSTRICR